MEQGQNDRHQASAADRARVVDPCQAPDRRLFGTRSLRRTKATLIYRRREICVPFRFCLAIPRSKAQFGILGLRSTMRSQSPSKSMSEYLVSDRSALCRVTTSLPETASVEKCRNRTHQRRTADWIVWISVASLIGRSSWANVHLRVPALEEISPCPTTRMIGKPGRCSHRARRHLAASAPYRVKLSTRHLAEHGSASRNNPSLVEKSRTQYPFDSISTFRESRTASSCSMT